MTDEANASLIREKLKGPLAMICQILTEARKEKIEVNFSGIMAQLPEARGADVTNFFQDRPTGIGLRNPPPAESPFKPIFDHAAGAQGEKPDYARAFIAPLALEGTEWKEFLAKTQTANPQGNA